jgi:hypothetical protein
MKIKRTPLIECIGTKKLLRSQQTHTFEICRITEISVDTQSALPADENHSRRALSTFAGQKCTAKWQAAAAHSASLSLSASPLGLGMEKVSSRALRWCSYK